MRCSIVLITLNKLASYKLILNGLTSTKLDKFGKVVHKITYV